MVFAAHEAMQESLGFSPADLVFGHTPRDLLKSLQERFFVASFFSFYECLRFC